MRTVLVECHENYSINELGVITNIKRKNVLVHIKGKQQYLYVELNRKKLKIHRLLAQAFIPNPNNYPCVNHIDGNKLNNNLDNLEWCTQSQNAIHAFDTGLRSREKEAERLSRVRHLANRRAILNTITGVVYSNGRKAAASIGMTPSMLCKRLKGIIPNNTNLVYADE